MHGAKQCGMVGGMLGGYVGGAVGSALVLTEAAVGLKTGAVLGSAAGPVGTVVGAAVGFGVGVAVYGVACGIGWLFSSSKKNQRSYTPPPTTPAPTTSRDVRKSSVQYQISQQQGGSGQSGGGGKDPNWWNNIKENDDGLSSLEIFQRIVQEILARLKGASRSDRLDLLNKLREALADLLKRHPNIKIYIEAGTRNLVLDDPNGDAIEIKAELIEALGVCNDAGAGLGLADVNQPCIYRIRCRDCGTNYVGQTVSPRERNRNHRASMKAKDSTKSLYQHHKEHRCVYGCKCDFEDTYDFIILMVLDAGSTYGILRPAEVFWQWLMKALKDDDGIGKN